MKTDTARRGPRLLRPALPVAAALVRGLARGILLRGVPFRLVLGRRHEPGAREATPPSCPECGRPLPLAVPPGGVAGPCLSCEERLTRTPAELEDTDLYPHRLAEWEEAMRRSSQERQAERR
jgi:hypothetical protein